MPPSGSDQEAVIVILNRILEAELAGVVRYTHYSFMVYGYGRIPIVSWLRAQADESLLHAQEAGELITALGGHPSLGIGDLLETQTVRHRRHSARVQGSRAGCAGPVSRPLAPCRGAGRDDRGIGATTDRS
jgi:hypothetical protein